MQAITGHSTAIRTPFTWIHNYAELNYSKEKQEHKNPQHKKSEDEEVEEYLNYFSILVINVYGNYEVSSIISF